MQFNMQSMIELWNYKGTWLMTFCTCMNISTANLLEFVFVLKVVSF